MTEDSTFFSAPEPVGGPGFTGEPELLHSSEGGWTELWKVDKDGRLRVLKALRPEFRGRAEYESLLSKEYQIGYSLSHPCIREIYGFSFVRGIGNAIEMEWVDGLTLDAFLKESRPGKAQRRKIAASLCDALEYLHSKQVIHRDIKPANILITHLGRNVKLIDFGLSDSDSWSVHKSAGGTRSFAAPELLKGLSANNRADIYSLGKVIGLLMPSKRAVIRRCTNPNPSRRYSDAEEVKAALCRGSSRWWMALAVVAATAVAVMVFRIYTQRPNNKEFPPEESSTVISDPGAIDEIFRQATEMIGED